MSEAKIHLDEFASVIAMMEADGCSDMTREEMIEFVSAEEMFIDMASLLLRGVKIIHDMRRRLEGDYGEDE